MAAFTLAHLSDPHLSPLPEPAWHELIGKRLTGYINWRRKRSAIHSPEVLQALVADLKAQQKDHIAVTGDFANLALPKEFENAHAFLKSLGGPSTVTAIPGNHDAYVASQRNGLANACADYMHGDGEELTSFPFVRRRGPIALIALSSAVPTPPFIAQGTLGPVQCAKLGDILEKLGREHVFRTVLVHHPLWSEPRDWYKRLTDSDALREVLRRHGAELILHGHDHKQERTPIDGPDGIISNIGVPSASSVFDDKHEGAAYNLYRIARVRDAWQIEMITRGLTTPGGLTVGELQRVRLNI